MQKTTFDPVEIIEGRPDGPPGLVLICDHASNAVPAGLDLGMSPDDMARHIAWDVGARGLTLGLAERLGAPAVLSRFSRLVIDPNRGADDPTLVMKLYDGSIIPGNRLVDAEEVARRVATLWQPYHDAIRDRLDREETRHRPALVSIHSFTPQLRGRPPRPWHVGLLYDRDERLVTPLRAELTAEPDLCIGDNEPYTGALEGDCMFQHGTARGIAHVLIEIRNDLIATEAGQEAWADRLSPMIARAVAGLDAGDLH
ncbi:MAG: N-formylglutamate amidohydrolase [Pseudomonadota bacterium]